MKKDDAGANYILTALLPRLEKLKPGLIEELAQGVNADKQAIKNSGKLTSELEEVFISAEKILGRT
ncbi:hypothetical protein [Pacificibacter marinus]|uniref:Uncharacterized protein n=1 Tax=Pacificibacter marinus TaxID=658057 RepID=A0A1Y5RTW9_9RHOB|nr:hypothetical protein [Pacificibacter marinus]SEK40008.1 hypothetical protein SAMN04488032_102197 [Pacificibacter marinus]SLN25371.1 hypothetical protein PAM7971_00889 [Pacificibacter marinus]